MTTVRLAVPDDSEALLALQHRLDAQSKFMMLEPGERERTPDRLRARLEASAGGAAGYDLVATADGALAGWLQVEVAPYRRAAHVGYVVLGVDADHAGRGIGSALLEEAAAEATRRGLRRLELTVMVDNLRAVSLYLRAGFRVEGLRRGSVRRDGAPVDEYLMARLLGAVR